MTRPGWTTAAAIALAVLLADAGGAMMPLASFVGEAQAKIGRPARPGSVAGVTRRTTRRVIHRSTIYVASLPRGCVTTSVNGVTVWHCGSRYYQRYGGRYVVIYIN
jgi:hypothetical protein